MQFSELYGAELTRELGSADVSQLFTTARRKAAINAGQLKFVERTECLKKNTTIPIVDGTQEYDIEATVSDFGFLHSDGPSIKITSGSNVRYIQGDDLEETSIARLNVEQPGWRAYSPGTPTAYYLDSDGGALNLGFVPAPDISGSDTWLVMLPYVAIPADMSADADEPFTVSSNPMKRLRFWHRAPVHYAAYDLEKFRKDVARGAAQLQLFELEIQSYIAAMKPKQGSAIRLAVNYRSGARGRVSRLDPRVSP